MNYPQLVLLPKKERSIINRHPWIFSGAVKQIRNASDGDIVEIVGNDAKVLGYGFYSQKSQIVCRMFEWSDHPQDFETVEYWQKKIESAILLRKGTVFNNSTNTYRLIHAEGDFLPGIIIDVYAEVAVLQILITGVERIKTLIQSALLNLGFNHRYLKTKVSAHVLEDVQKESEWLSGGVAAPVIVRENDVTFAVDFVKGQKTGFFIDQRDNRKLLESYCEGKRVLNAFSYSGGFSVYALKGKAIEVCSLDISKDAIATAEENVRMNGYDSNHKGIVKDCFEYLKDMEENLFDIIVLDPPAFAKHARAVENASRGYKQINLRAFQKIRPNGIVFTFSCSQNISKDLFQKIVFSAAADARRNVRIIHQLHQPLDHPINIFHPEGEYLKGLVLSVE